MKKRTKWNEKEKEYYFSVIDVVGELNESKNPRDYWYQLKKHELENGIDLSTNCRQLIMPARDGKMRETDVATAKQLFRIIQSIPSPNAEPFKQWMAELGQNRLGEIANPELALERAINTYREKGCTEEWISQRLRSIEVRKDLTAEWKLFT